MSGTAASFALTSDAAGRRMLAVSGDWTIWTIAGIDEALRRTPAGDDMLVDVSALGHLDTSGAFLLRRALRAEGPLTGEDRARLVGAHPFARDLVAAVGEIDPGLHPDRPHDPGFHAMLERVGRGVIEARNEALGILSFIGESLVTLARLLLRPARIRWTSVVSVMETAGLDALPIVAFLSFFIGLVIAFLGANLLAQFGASVFTVEMVGILMLREFGVVLTAILLAGRTDSAFTAQIGAMNMRQEIDAMRVLGLSPMEVLVVPRIIALVVMTPLLAFGATLAGIAGGLAAAWASLDISPAMFLARFQQTVPAQHFWAGIAKAPVFALIVALVGCRQGLLVEGDVNSLGSRTTSSVVQAIFLVIVVDALFAIVYYEMGI